MHKKRYMTMYIAITALVLAGCAAHLTPQHTAMSLAREGGLLYFSLEEQYKARIADRNIPEEERIAFSRAVVPLLNRFKDMEIAYLDAVIYWAKTGQQPQNFTEIQTAYNTMVQDILRLFKK